MQRAIASWLAALAVAGCGPLPYEATQPAEAPPVVEVPTPASVIVRVGADDRFPIRLAWPAKTGQKGYLRFESDNTRATRLRRDGQPDEVANVDRHVSAEGVYEVLAVDEDGTATSVRFDARAFSLRDDTGGSLDLDGAKIRVDRAPDEAHALVLVNDRAADADVRKAIDEVIPLAITDLPPDDEVVGTSEPQRVGARWPIEAESARQALSEDILRIPRGAVSGETQFANVLDRGGIRCLEIVGRLDVEPFEVTELPPGAKIQHARIHVVTHAIVPTSPMPRLENEITTTAELAMTIDGADLVETFSKKQSHSWYDPLPGG